LGCKGVRGSFGEWSDGDKSVSDSEQADRGDRGSVRSAATTGNVRL